MRINKFFISIAALFIIFSTGCSFYDFFSYEENTGLYTVNRPEGYPSIRFANVMALTNDEDRDILGVTAGTGNPTMWYTLSDSTGILDITSPSDEYKARSKEREEADRIGSGADLAGLPSFFYSINYASGCTAIGEPDRGAHLLHMRCNNGDVSYDIGLPDDQEVPSSNWVSADNWDNQLDFGHELAAIRPGKYGNWLLGVATSYELIVYSSRKSYTNYIHPPVGGIGGNRPREITKLEGGRIDEERYFLAVATVDPQLNHKRVYLYSPEVDNSKNLVQVGCITNDEYELFGNAMTIGNLGDAAGGAEDELILYGKGPNFNTEEDSVIIQDMVFIYDVGEVMRLSALSDNGCIDVKDATIAVIESAKDFGAGIKCPLFKCDFGVSLAVGDISTDDNNPELIVGAQRATVDGEKEAGAFFVYRGSDIMENTIDIAGYVTDSTPEKNSWFGGTLMVAPIAGRNEVISGVTEKGKFYIVYCTGVGSNIHDGADVTTNENGSVISTRCRPPKQ